MTCPETHTQTNTWKSQSALYELRLAQCSIVINEAREIKGAIRF